MANPFRTMFWDVEVSPNVCTSWRVGSKIFLTADNIVKERAIICICWKWEDEEEVYHLTWDKNQCDKTMLQKFVKELNKAHLIIGQNSDNFDERWIKTRCIFHDIPALPKYTSIDTLKIARKTFNFNSNRLDYMGKFLGVGQKIKTEFDLWNKIIFNKDAKAMNYMVDYCKQDVILLEQVYKKLQRYAEPKIHKAVALGGEKWDCPHCASERVMISTTKFSKVGTVWTQMKCNACKRYFSISEATRRAYLEFKLKQERRKHNL